MEAHLGFVVLLATAGLAWEKFSSNVWHDTTLRDDNVAEETVQFFVVTDGELQVSGNNTLLLVITSGITSQLENLSSEVFKNGSKINWGTSSYTLGVVALLQQTVHTTDWELETSLGRAGLGLVRAASLSSGRWA